MRETLRGLPNGIRNITTCVPNVIEGAELSRFRMFPRGTEYNVEGLTYISGAKGFSKRFLEILSELRSQQEASGGRVGLFHSFDDEGNSTGVCHESGRKVTTLAHAAIADLLLTAAAGSDAVVADFNACRSLNTVVALTQKILHMPGVIERIYASMHFRGPFVSVGSLLKEASKEFGIALWIEVIEDAEKKAVAAHIAAATKAFLHERDPVRKEEMRKEAGLMQCLIAERAGFARHRPNRWLDAPVEGWFEAELRASLVRDVSRDTTADVTAATDAGARTVIAETADAVFKRRLAELPKGDPARIEILDLVQTEDLPELEPEKLGELARFIEAKRSELARVDSQRESEGKVLSWLHYAILVTIRDFHGPLSGKAAGDISHELEAVARMPTRERLEALALRSLAVVCARGSSRPDEKTAVKEIVDAKIGESGGDNLMVMCSSTTYGNCHGTNEKGGAPIGMMTRLKGEWLAQDGPERKSWLRAAQTVRRRQISVGELGGRSWVGLRVADQNPSLLVGLPNADLVQPPRMYARENIIPREDERDLRGPHFSGAVAAVDAPVTVVPRYDERDPQEPLFGGVVAAVDAPVRVAVPADAGEKGEALRAIEVMIVTDLTGLPIATVSDYRRLSPERRARVPEFCDEVSEAFARELGCEVGGADVMFALEILAMTCIVAGRDTLETCRPALATLKSRRVDACDRSSDSRAEDDSHGDSRLADAPSSEGGKE
jgi:hypothetical protein